MKISAPRALVDLINSLPKNDRLAAMRFAERHMANRFATLERFGDYGQKQNIDMATAATVAEIVYRMALRSETKK
jgi:hypothetical protein